MKARLMCRIAINGAESVSERVCWIVWVNSYPKSKCAQRGLECEIEGVWECCRFVDFAKQIRKGHRSVME